jgi:dephospho-CoA kinase
LLKLHGFFIIDADAIAHATLETLHKELRDLFGCEVVKEDKVDRKTLGAIVFGDPKKRELLENLTHPLIRQKIIDAANERESFKKPYIVDIPLFFESNAYPINKVIVVYAPQEIQKMRLIDRDGFSLDQAQARLDAQLSIEEKKQKATFVIDNSGNLKHLQNEVNTLVAHLKEKYDC